MLGQRLRRWPNLKPALSGKAHSDLRDHISDPTHSYSRLHAWLYTFLNNNTPHSEQRRTVLIRQTVHAQTRASSLLGRFISRYYMQYCFAITVPLL